MSQREEIKLEPEWFMVADPYLKSESGGNGSESGGGAPESLGIAGNNIANSKYVRLRFLGSHDMDSNNDFTVSRYSIAFYDGDTEIPPNDGILFSSNDTLANATKAFDSDPSTLWTNTSINGDIDPGFNAVGRSFYIGMNILDTYNVTKIVYTRVGGSDGVQTAYDESTDGVNWNEVFQTSEHHIVGHGGPGPIEIILANESGGK